MAETEEQRIAREAKEKAERAQKEAADQAQTSSGGSWGLIDKLDLMTRSNANSNERSWWKVGTVAALGGVGALAGAQVGWLGAIGLGLAGALAGLFGADPILTFLGIEPPKDQVRLPPPVERPHVPDPNKNVVKEQDITLPAVSVKQKDKVAPIDAQTVRVATYIKSENPDPLFKGDLAGKPLSGARKQLEEWYKLAAEADPAKDENNARLRKFVKQLDLPLLQYEVNIRYGAAKFNELKDNTKITAYLKSIGMQEAQIKTLLPMPDEVGKALTNFNALVDHENNELKSLEDYGKDMLRRNLARGRKIDLNNIDANQANQLAAEAETLWKGMNAVQKRHFIIAEAESVKYLAAAEGSQFDYRRYFSYFTDEIIGKPQALRDGATRAEQLWHGAHDALANFRITKPTRILDRLTDSEFSALANAHNAALAAEGSDPVEARKKWDEVLQLLKNRKTDGGLSNERHAALNKHIGWLEARLHLEDMEKHLLEHVPGQLNALKEFEDKVIGSPEKLQRLQKAVEQHKQTGLFVFEAQPGKVKVKDTRQEKEYVITYEGGKYTVHDQSKSGTKPSATIAVAAGADPLDPAQLRKAIDEAFKRPVAIKDWGSWMGSMVNVTTQEPVAPTPPPAPPATPAPTPGR